MYPSGSSISKGFFSSAKRKSGGSAKKQDRSKKKGLENKQTDAVNTESDGHPEETPVKNAVNPSEETNSGGKESGFSMYFSDNEDMNVDFDIDSDGGSESQMRNEENDAEDAADSDGEDMTPEHSNRHERKRKAPTLSENNSDKTLDTAANPVEEKGSDEGRIKGDAELSAWLNVNSNDSFSSLCTGNINLTGKVYRTHHLDICGLICGALVSAT